MSSDMTFPAMWFVQPAKAQTSLRIRTVWSEPLLVAWISYDCSTFDRTAFRVSKFNRRLHRLVWVYSCQNATLLEITCRGSIMIQVHCYSLWLYNADTYAQPKIQLRHKLENKFCYFYFSYNVASGSEITPCIKIDKPPLVYRFLGKGYYIYNNVAYIMTK